MEAIASYVLRLCCGALICALIQSVSGNSGPYAKMRTMLCSIYLAFLAITPLRDLDPEALLRPEPAWVTTGEALALEGATQAQNAYTELISQQYSAYILTKAEALSLSLDAEVMLDEKNGLLTGVELTGLATPYEKMILESYIEQNLGLEGGRIHWKP